MLSGQLLEGTEEGREDILDGNWMGFRRRHSKHGHILFLPYTWEGSGTVWVSGGKQTSFPPITTQCPVLHQAIEGTQ